MLDMTTTHLLVTIAIAIASGLAIIAFKTPRIYAKLFYPLIGVLVAAEILSAVWNFGYSHGHSILLQYISHEKLSEAFKAYEDARLPISFLLYLFLAFIYIAFLRWLSDEVIKHQNEDKPKNKTLDE